MSIPLCEKCQYHHFPESKCVSARDRYKPFEPYWDEHIAWHGQPVYISSPADRKKWMRRQFVNDFYHEVREKRGYG